MKNAMKFLTLCVLAGVVVAMCGCTSPSNNAVPTVTSTVHTNNTTKAAVKTTKAVVKPATKTTVKPTPAMATPVPYTPTTPTTPNAPVTGSFGQSSYVFANGTVVTATVSNWQSNPTVAIGSTAHAQTIPMQSLGNGKYTYTFEGVIFTVHGSGSGGMTLVDNGVTLASATTTWSNPAPTATPKQAPTLTWTSDMPPQSGVMQGGYADFMAYYNDHPASGLGAFYTPKWYVDGQLVYTGTPTQAYVSWGADTANLSIGSHTVTLDAAGTGLSITATFTVIPAAK
jgi:hypothetical protein